MMLKGGWAKLSHFAFPEFTGTRIMMMPFHIHDPVGSLPHWLQPYAEEIKRLGLLEWGVGYLTIDEANLRLGEHHRRPGLHVDGLGGWGGGGPWAKKGMVCAASAPGCRMWNTNFEVEVGEDGDCEQVRPQLGAGHDMEANTAYHMEPLTVHETLPQLQDGPRQFLRISFPSDAPWYEGYTKNPLGIQPRGPIHPPRIAQMSYR